MPRCASQQPQAVRARLDLRRGRLGALALAVDDTDTSEGPHPIYDAVLCYGVLMYLQAGGGRS